MYFRVARLSTTKWFMSQCRIAGVRSSRSSFGSHRSAREPRWVRLDEELKRRLPEFGDLRLERAPVHGRQVGVVGLVRLRAEEVVRLVGRDTTL
jgi:hypothetical protein